ncbi:MAG: hypothetical protein CL868_21490 [Cytophagaceae bacterium]|nr:hypothetical protein [Cytophagaceae bacterium]|tara:strand:+ start:907 stop:1758 length:852 start_codon:yes stop_codon:yes gene_type:complete
MKNLLFLLFPFLALSQNNEVYLLDLNIGSNTVSVANGKNISMNDGYDNQPSFYDDETILFSSNHNGQNDVASYNMKSGKKTWITNTTEGGEYSPQRIPETNEISAVRLDTTGLQLLYKIDTNGKSAVLVPNQVIGYSAFYNKDKMISAVLNNGTLDLVINDLSAKRNDTIISGIGRSLHKVPGTESMSYTLINEDGNMDVYLLEMDSLESYYVCELPIGIQDYAWIDRDRMILGSRSGLFMYDLMGITEWKQIADLSNLNLDTITRIAVSSNKKKIAIVAEKQ